MRRLLASILGAWLLAVALPASAQSSYLRMNSEKPGAGDPGCPNGACITAGGLDAAKYTGWILVEGWAKATFDVTFVDANDSVTAVTTVCYTANNASGANGTGAEICSGSTSSGTTTVTCPHTWSLTTGTAEHWAFTVDNLNGLYLNCAFDATGTPAAADTVTVTVLRRAP